MFFENSVGLVGNTVGEVPSSSVGEVKFFLYLARASYILPSHHTATRISPPEWKLNSYT